MPDDDTSRFYDTNRARWDESVAIHVASEGYDMAGFLRGEKALYDVELAEVSDVAGKSLLHLQCHFGMDTLNWARLGATVTGLDFSEPAIEQARALAAQIGINDATFVQSNLYDAREAIEGQFDVVYTGIGALGWLHDIREWARIVAHFVRPGGLFYIYEGHPVLWALDFDRDGEDHQLVLSEPYFETAKPSEYDGEFTYTDGPPLRNTKTFEWNHGLGEIVTALIDAGLRIEFLHEHREMAWQGLPWMIPSEGPPAATRHKRRTAWRLPDDQADRCPLMYSIRATKPL